MNAIEVQDREVLDYLRQLQDKLDDMTPAMDAIGQRLEEQISYRFETETDLRGAAWKPWADSTRKAYPKDGHRRLLDRHGDLMKMSHQADRNSVTVGSGALYAAFHEYGTKRMPRRGFLFDDPNTGTLGEDDQRTILEIVQGYLEG